MVSTHNFRDVIARHNLGRDNTLKQLRDYFAGVAPQLAQFVKLNLGKDYADEMYPILDRELSTLHQEDHLPHACDLDEDLLRDLFLDSRAPNQYIFNPWEGYWEGPWKSLYPQQPETNYETVHKYVWGETEAGQSGQFIQARTISSGEQGYVTDETIEDLAPATGEGEAANIYDPAINVVNSQGQVTGWVSCRKDRQYELPQVGYYALDPQKGAHILIWITQTQDINGNPLSPGHFFVYFHWAKWVKGRGHYGVLGTELIVRPGGTELATNDNQHAGLFQGRPLLEGPTF